MIRDYFSVFAVGALALQLTGCRLSVRGVESAASAPTCDASKLPYGGGSGSAAEPYQICARIHLENISLNPTSSFILKSDLNLGGVGTPFTPIPTFSGTLDGNSKTISNLFSTAGGLFASTTLGAYIHHLTLDGATVNPGANGAGVLINLASDTTLDYITVSNSSVNNAGFNFTGGVVGAMYHTAGLNSVDHTFADNVIVTANQGAGGIAGFAASGTITRTHATGNITALVSHAGGLIGSSDSAGAGLPPGQTAMNFSLTYTSGSVTGPKKIGGLIGAGNPVIQKSYSNASVTGNGGCDTGNIFCESGIDVGGLVGALKGSVTTSFAFGTVTSNGKKVGGLLGAATNTSVVSISFATMNVNGAFFAGGIIGYNEAISVSDSYTLATLVDESMQVFSPAVSSFGDFGQNLGGAVSNIYFNWDGFYSYSGGPAMGPLTTCAGSAGILNAAAFSQPAPTGPAFDYTTPVWRYTSATPWGVNSPVPQWVCLEGASVGLAVTCAP